MIAIVNCKRRYSRLRGLWKFDLDSCRLNSRLTGRRRAARRVEFWAVAGRSRLEATLTANRYSVACPDPGLGADRWATKEGAALMPKSQDSCIDFYFCSLSYFLCFFITCIIFMSTSSLSSQCEIANGPAFFSGVSTAAPSAALVERCYCGWP